MPQWTNQSLREIIIIVLIVGTSVASWAYRQYKQYQAAKQVKDNQLRRQEQIMRTGRDDPEAAVSVEPINEHELAKRRLQELVEQRRRELQAAGNRPKPVAPPVAAAPNSSANVNSPNSSRPRPVPSRPPHCTPRSVAPPNARPRPKWTFRPSHPPARSPRPASASPAWGRSASLAPNSSAAPSP